LDKIKAEIIYAGRMTERAWIEADVGTNVPEDSRLVDIVDACTCKDSPLVTREGFQLVKSPTRVVDFRDRRAVEELYFEDMCNMIAELTGADCVVPIGPGTLLRFSARSPEANRLQTTATARMAHSDVTAKDAAKFVTDYPPTENRPIKRAAHHNIWRAFSAPPQDVPLAVCDARTVAIEDLIATDFRPGPRQTDVPAFEVLFVQYSPAHRWYYYSNMTRDDALVFKRFDTDAAQPCYVPHTGFSHPHATDGWEPRASIEFRTMTYWYE
jgi:hypothetical protein